MSFGRSIWKEEREIISRVLSNQDGVLRDNANLQSKVLVDIHEVEMMLPARIGNYTDFYASKEHATNIGTMWRGKENALLPNWSEKEYFFWKSHTILTGYTSRLDIMEEHPLLLFQVHL